MSELTMPERWGRVSPTARKVMLVCLQYGEALGGKTWNELPHDVQLNLENMMVPKNKPPKDERPIAQQWDSLTDNKREGIMKLLNLPEVLRNMKWGNNMLPKEVKAITTYLVEGKINPLEKEATTGYVSYQSATVSPSCVHKQQAVKVGDKIIYCSEQAYSGWKERKIIPNLGVYMASFWADHITIVKAAGVKLPKSFYSYPFIELDWPDGGIIDDALLDWVVQFIIKRLNLGQEVEIGCMGGHGRTGTLLACVLGSMENIHASKAIKEVRKRYCEKAVETRKQVKLVGTYLGGSVKGVEPTRGYGGNVTVYSPGSYGGYWDSAKNKYIPKEIWDSNTKMWKKNPEYDENYANMKGAPYGGAGGYMGYGGADVY